MITTTLQVSLNTFGMNRNIHQSSVDIQVEHEYQVDLLVNGGPVWAVDTGV